MGTYDLQYDELLEKLTLRLAKTLFHTNVLAWQLQDFKQC